MDKKKLMLRKNSFYVDEILNNFKDKLNDKLPEISNKIFETNIKKITFEITKLEENDKKKILKKMGNEMVREMIQIDYYLKLIDLLVKNGIKIKKNGIQVNHSENYKIIIDANDFDKAIQIIKDECIIIRSRWDAEDTLILNRTGIFLTANALLFGFTAAKIASSGFYAFSIDALFILLPIILAIIISFIWNKCTKESRIIIKYLSKIYEIVRPLAIKIYHDYIIFKTWPNKLLSYLPKIILGCGFAFIITIFLKILGIFK